MLQAKLQQASYPALTDPLGRLLSYQLLHGPDGGVSDTLSGLTTPSNFTSYNVPNPIITALSVKTFQGECTPGPNATQPHILASPLPNGKPTNGTCIKNHDNLGYVLGTSSNLFNENCAPIPPINSTAQTLIGLFQDLAALVDQVHSVGTREEYAVYPSPLRNYSHYSLVAAQNEVSLVDGGEILQNNPIWPLLHRAVDVILVNDNSTDTNNFSNGSKIYTTYQQARDQKLARMPVIPPVDVFLANGYNKRPTFFGCNDNSKTTIIYIPNYNYTCPSNQPASKLQYTVAETDAMIANGVQIATKGGDKGWPLCLACGIMKKAGGSLPSGCASCFTQYCYN